MQLDNAAYRGDFEESAKPMILATKNCDQNSSLCVGRFMCNRHTLLRYDLGFTASVVAAGNTTKSLVTFNLDSLCATLQLVLQHLVS